MRLYLVRHGESEGNARHIHQSSQTPLSDIGQMQAKLLAHRCKSLPIDIILASNYLRAQQTAEIINAVVQKTIEYTPLLQEVKRPTTVEGGRVIDPENIRINKLIVDRRNDLNWHHSDEENFLDKKSRAKKCLQYVTSRPETNILAVTHGQMLCVLMCSMAFGEDYTPDMLKAVYSTFHSTNTGLTVVEYVAQKWRFITWNDHAHLG